MHNNNNNNNTLILIELYEHYLILTNLWVFDIIIERIKKKNVCKGVVHLLYSSYSKEAAAKTLSSGVKVAVPGKWHCWLCKSTGSGLG